MSIFDRVGEKISSVDRTISKINHYEKKVSHLINDPIGTLTGSSKLGALSSGEIAMLIARPDALMSFNWEVALPSVNAAREYNLGSEYVETCSISLPDYGIRQVREFGRMMSYPEASPTINTLQLQFYGDVQNTAMSYLNAWRTLIHPVTGAFGTPNKPKTSSVDGYKKDIILYSKDSYNEKVFSITYKGCWPTAIEGSTYFNSDNDRISFIVTFAVDDVIVSGYNIDTITNTIKTTITGTIKGLAGAIGNIATGAAKSVIGTVTKPVTDAVGRGLRNLNSAITGSGESNSGNQS